jgi:hypothetical protein
MNITMSNSEIELFSRFLSSSSQYFEFGMGGSTCLAAELVKKKIYAVDSDVAWIDKVRTEIGETNKEVKLIHVDIGPTGSWGMPKSSKMNEMFPAYSDAILEANVEEIDICLVDGRFRVACFLKALSSLNSSAVIAMHDYRDRPHYHIIEKYARPIAQCQQLYFFVKRPDADMRALFAQLESHRNNPA